MHANPLLAPPLLALEPPLIGHLASLPEWVVPYRGQVQSLEVSDMYLTVSIGLESFLHMHVDDLQALPASHLARDT
ncbi:hypothetical protein MSAN_01731600 [Mycena sanguinolenta]|uniref:Uncharacterized protein n=1 Tax=Mycena sanguinolenta TaxID=230812 RepID=A0A8H6Y027_9AGAR|nr:hypothetical protein MSAN_01731600 [Mycena sanguinolenta]